MTQASTTAPLSAQRHPATRLVLTDKTIDALPQVALGRVTYRDARTSQLVLLIGPRVRAWYLHATVHNRTHRVRLGPWPIISTDTARDACLEALRKIYRGESPRLERPKAAPTVGKVLAEYLEARDLSKQAAADLRSVIGKHVADWSGRGVDTLTATAVAARYRAVAAGSTASAQRLLGALGALDRFAHAAHGIGDGNLAARVRALLGSVDTVEPRSVTIPDDSQPAWFAAVSACSPGVRRYLMALMLTGCRANELRHLPRKGWDEKAGVIRIATTKNGKPHSLPVGSHLRQILEDEAGSTSGATLRDEAGNLIEPTLFGVSERAYREAVARIGAAIGVDWHLHDLRRTFATAATRAGVDEGALKALMNHSTAGNVTARHYVQRTAEDLRPAMQKVEAHLLGLWGAAA